MIAPDHILMAYVDGELSRQQHRSVEVWLSTDEAARREVAMFRMTGNMARLAHEQPIWMTPPAAAMSTLATLPGIGLRQAFRIYFGRRRMVIATGATAAMVLWLLAAGLVRDAGPAKGAHGAAPTHTFPAVVQVPSTESERSRQ